MSTKTRSSKAKADTQPSAEQRQHYIEVAAYHIAEKSEFNCGGDLDNWLAAEAKIDQMLAGGKLLLTQRE